MPDFRIDDEQFQALIAKQVLDSINSETRENLVAEAVKFLMSETKNQYNRTPEPSPLMRAFQQELVKIAQKIAQEVLSDEVIRAEVEKSLREYLQQAINERGFDLSYVIGNAIRDNLDVSFKSN